MNLKYTTIAGINQVCTKLTTENLPGLVGRGLNFLHPLCKRVIFKNTLTFPRMLSVEENAQKVYNPTRCQRKEAGVLLVGGR